MIEKKHKQYVIIAILLFTLHSCVFLEFDYTIKSNYKNAIGDSKLNVVFDDDNICNRNYNDTIYAVKGKKLKSCLSSINKAVVYTWAPHCKNEDCLSIGVVQEYCNQKGYELFVVCTFYDPEQIAIQTKPTRPFFSIDHFYHGHKMHGERSRFTLFIKELTGGKENVGGFMEFINGEYNRDITAKSILKLD